MPQPLSNILFRTDYDIPVWARTGLVVAGLCGVVVIVVASLAGGKESTIGVDKLLHFGGYATLAAILVMVLRPRWCLPALILLALLSLAVEVLQPFNARTFDLRDLAANLLGLTLGAGAGVLLRLAGQAVSTRVKRAQFRKDRRTYGAGALILKQGAGVDRFFVIDHGRVQLTREVDGRRQVLGTLGPGEVFGLLGVLQSKPQYATVEALEPTTVYGLDLQEFLSVSGGPVEPVETLLQVMARHLRGLADRVVEVERIVP